MVMPDEAKVVVLVFGERLDGTKTGADMHLEFQQLLQRAAATAPGGGGSGGVVEEEGEE